jgi:hypothetical protein
MEQPRDDKGNYGCSRFRYGILSKGKVDCSLHIEKRHVIKTNIKRNDAKLIARTFKTAWIIRFHRLPQNSEGDKLSVIGACMTVTVLNPVNRPIVTATASVPPSKHRNVRPGTKNERIVSLKVVISNKEAPFHVMRDTVTHMQECNC